MASFNQITICGYLGRDPELRRTPQGLAVTNFSIATTEKRKTNDEAQEFTTWFRVTLWGKQAEVAMEYLKKGSHVFVIGSVRLNEYSNREGTTRVSLEVNGSSFHMLGGRSDASPMEEPATNHGERGSSRADGGPETARRSKELIDEDIPF